MSLPLQLATTSSSSWEKRSAGRPRYVRSTRSPARSSTSSSTKRGQLLVVDTRDVLDVRADVDQAHSQASHAVIVVFATSEAEKQLNAALKGASVFAVLPIPIDKRKTAAVLDGAMTDAVAKKAAARPNPGSNVTIESFQPRQDAGASPPEEQKSKAGLFAIIGVAGVALAAGGGYFLLNKDKASAPAHGGQRGQQDTTPDPGGDAGADAATADDEPRCATGRRHPHRQR